ncbi:MAG: hypothetical protein ACPG61_16475 [Paracoccaceae bacterium]
MFRYALAFALVASPVLAADSKTESCDYQAQIVAAIQQARLDKVKERNVVKHLAASEQTWPSNYNAAIPIMTPWVYEQKMRDIRKKDLSAAWKELCVKQG